MSTEATATYNMEMEAESVCEGNTKTPIQASQWIALENCDLTYQLVLTGWIENDTVVEDCDVMDVLGEVDVEAQRIEPGIGVLATTYSGEECPDGTPFSSAPGTLAESPC